MLNMVIVKNQQIYEYKKLRRTKTADITKS